MLRKPPERKAVAKLFTNWTKEDFTHTWDGVPYTFKAGDSVMIMDYLADHFAKHLANREIARKKTGLMKGQIAIDYINKALGNTVEAQNTEKLQMKIDNPSNELTPEDEFDGLKDESKPVKAGRIQPGEGKK